MEFGVRWDVEKAVKDLLLDPGSYEKDSITARRLFAAERSDGSQYYSAVTVRFRAKNTFGGYARGTAWVELNEDAEEGCTVVRANLASDNL